jgi:type VI secretion system protein ImpB
VPAVPAKESVNKKLERVRPPRVHVTYDVEVGDAIEVRELPFVMGVMADLSGQPTEDLPRLKDRRFVEVTPDNFDNVLESFKPHLAFTVENKLSEEANAGQLRVSLDFRKLEDFEPAQVARQVEPLKQLMDLREKLGDLRGALQGNTKLEDILTESIGNTEKLGRLKKELEEEKGTGA